MSQQDINKDLGSYLSERKSKPFWKRSDIKKIHPKHKEEDMDTAIQQELKRDFEHTAEEEEKHISPHDKKELHSMEKEIEEVHEEEKAIEEKQEGKLKKFFKKLNFSKENDDDEKAYEPAVMSNNPDVEMSDEELRELLHGLHNWIIQLPADKLERFKNSKEFELYTKYLRKHNLIK